MKRNPGQRHTFSAERQKPALQQEFSQVTCSTSSGENSRYISTVRIELRHNQAVPSFLKGSLPSSTIVYSGRPEEISMSY